MLVVVAVSYVRQWPKEQLQRGMCRGRGKKQKLSKSNQKDSIVQQQQQQHVLFPLGNLFLPQKELKERLAHCPQKQNNTHTHTSFNVAAAKDVAAGKGQPAAVNAMDQLTHKTTHQRAG